MKEGLGITDLAQQIEQSDKAKRDFLCNTEGIWVSPDEGSPKMAIPGIGDFTINPIAHNQLADRLDIPRKYYTKMLAETPLLLANNVNTWFNKRPEKRLVRTLNGGVRAFLSDKYRPLDHLLIARAALPVLADMPGLTIASCQLTESRMYIQCYTESMKGEPRVGDVVHRGIVISNSEVGMGSVRIERLLYRLWCKNGSISGESLKRFHVGKALGSEQDINAEYLTDETIQADNHAFGLKIRDMLTAAFNEDIFEREMQQLEIAAGRKITAKGTEAILEIGKKYSLAENEKSDVTENLYRDGDFTQYGLGNAVTRLANSKALNYDRAIELERIGGDIFGLPEGALTSIAA